MQLVNLPPLDLQDFYYFIRNLETAQEFTIATIIYGIAQEFATMWELFGY